MPSRFMNALAQSLMRRGIKHENFCTADDRMTRRVLEEYGAMFVADESVRVPAVCVFASEDEVENFQREAKCAAAPFGDEQIELQPAALEALLAARREAHRLGLDIRPRGGSEAARRNYADTVRLWSSRCHPALDYWCAQGRLTNERASRLRERALREQVEEVLELEEQGIFFSKDFSKSILYSVAAPGASQHLAMLAFDATEFLNLDVRRILARHGWFQTIRNDRPHFTFLGHKESELPAYGLRATTCKDGQTYWIPDLREAVESQQ